MQAITIGLDIAEGVFQLHGEDGEPAASSPRSGSGERGW